MIFQFPLCWYAMPAILKGWVDRVFTYHFAHGVGEHSATRYGDRFGEGTLAGKQADDMLRFPTQLESVAVTDFSCGWRGFGPVPRAAVSRRSRGGSFGNIIPSSGKSA